MPEEIPPLQPYDPSKFPDSVPGFKAGTHCPRCLSPIAASKECPVKNCPVATETEVIFRRFITGGTIIALFPAIAATEHWHEFLSYEHIGQHGAANVSQIIHSTKPTYRLSPDVTALAQELTDRGYVLKEIRTALKRHQTQRIEQIAAMYPRKHTTYTLHGNSKAAREAKQSRVATRD